MIDRSDVRAIALARRGATHVGLFRERVDVYKVCRKVFAVCDNADGLTFKATEIAYAILTEDGPGRPAPGFTPGKGFWVSVPFETTEREDAESWIVTSYELVTRALTKAARAELGLTKAIGR